LAGAANGLLAASRDA